MKRSSIFYCAVFSLTLLAVACNGQAQTIYTIPDLILCLAPQDSAYRYGFPKAFGHFNDDPYEDLVVLARFLYNVEGQYLGKAFLYYGTVGGIDPASAIEIEGLYPTIVDPGLRRAYNRGLSSVTTGDFDNDGYDDLAMGSRGVRLR